MKPTPYTNCQTSLPYRRRYTVPNRARCFSSCRSFCRVNACAVSRLLGPSHHPPPPYHPSIHHQSAAVRRSCRSSVAIKCRPRAAHQLYRPARARAGSGPCAIGSARALPEVSPGSKSLFPLFCSLNSLLCFTHLGLVFTLLRRDGARLVCDRVGAVHRFHR